MLKKIALPLVALVVLLMLSTAPAKAGVSFGITVGPPVYTNPAPYYYQDPYAYNPYAYDYYNYPAPTYVYPYSYGSGYYGGHWDRDRGHEWREHEEHEAREHGGFRGGYQNFHGEHRR